MPLTGLEWSFLLKEKGIGEDGEVSYEVEFISNGIEKEIELDENGKILEFEVNKKKSLHNLETPSFPKKKKCV